MESKILGVKIKPLRRIEDDRGWLMEILRDDDPDFVRFGQVYLSTCYPGIVKAWHAHRKQTDNLCVLHGAAKIGLFDGRPDSPTYRQADTVILSERAAFLLQVPPLVWHGQMALGNAPSYLLNIPSEHYNYEDPDELRADPFDNDFGYEWRPKSR